MSFCAPTLAPRNAAYFCNVQEVAQSLINVGVDRIRAWSYAYKVCEATPKTVPRNTAYFRNVAEIAQYLINAGVDRTRAWWYAYDWCDANPGKGLSDLKPVEPVEPSSRGFVQALTSEPVIAQLSPEELVEFHKEHEHLWKEAKERHESWQPPVPRQLSPEELEKYYEFG
jgi:hypothetical protein